MAGALVAAIVIGTSVRFAPVGEEFLIPSIIIETNAFKCGWHRTIGNVNLTFVSSNPLNDETALLFSVGGFEPAEVHRFISPSVTFKMTFSFAGVIINELNEMMELRLHHGQDRVTIKLEGGNGDHVIILKNNKLSIAWRGNETTTDFDGMFDKISIFTSGVVGNLYFVQMKAFYTF